MSAGAWFMLIAVGVTLVTLGFLVVSMVRSITVHREPGRSVWREFGLGLSLMLLFLATWVAHGITEWQRYTDQQRQEGQETELGDFTAEFAQSTLENWQSEFLQLFSFVVLAALYVHKGSAESKDSEEKIEASLRRIEQRLGTLPASAPQGDGEAWQLPDTPMEVNDRTSGKS
jgi:hypothetical protein